VTLKVPPVGGIVPINAMPSGRHVILPAGSTIQVTKEEDHMDVLGALVAGTDLPVIVTLRAINETRARSVVETVEIAIDGQPVGVLSTASAGNMLPIVKHLADLSLTPVARATLKGNALKAEVVLHVAKSHDLDRAWIESLPEVP
jgi:hypothetical protein